MLCRSSEFISVAWNMWLTVIEICIKAVNSALTSLLSQKMHHAENIFFAVSKKSNAFECLCKTYLNQNPPPLPQSPCHFVIRLYKTHIPCLNYLNTQVVSWRNCQKWVIWVAWMLCSYGLKCLNARPPSVVLRNAMKSHDGLKGAFGDTSEFS